MFSVLSPGAITVRRGRLFSLQIRKVGRNLVMKI
jgi:hypothetical protein